jgi:periplasmic protein TonB
MVRLLGGVFALVLIAGFVWFVRTMMAAKSGKPDRQIQTVQIIRPPPPPPPDQPPPPPPEKTEEQLPKDKPEEPPPDNSPPPAGPLGLDAQGTAGEDAFGLAARAGGGDLVGGNGTAAFAWYTNRLRDAIRDKLAADGRIGSKRFSLSVLVWIEPDGRIRQVKPVSSTGDGALDKAIEADVNSIQKLSDSPPLEMPQPIRMQIVSRS